MNIIYSKKKLTGKTVLYEEGGIVYFKKITLLEKTIHQIPLASLSRGIYFSRAYHAPFFILPVFFSFMSIRLIIKKWNVGDWTLYLGLTVFLAIVLGLIYYFTIGKNTGEVELQLGDLTLPLFMNQKDYQELKERLEHLPN